MILVLTVQNVVSRAVSMFLRVIGRGPERVEGEINLDAAS